MRGNKFILFLICILALVTLASCGGDSSGDKIDVVCSGFAEYDWTLNVIGQNMDKFNVTYLLDDGTDPHSFQPTITDIAKVSDSDLFIYMGGESDKWSRDIVKNAANRGIVKVCLYELFKDDLLPMSDSFCEEDDHSHTHDGDDHNHAGQDEHFLLSLKNAEVAVMRIRDALCLVDTEGSDVYTASAEAYVNELRALQGGYEACVAAGENDTLLFADRFPFAYLARDLSLKYYSAYAGCSAESELGQEKIIFLANKLDELTLDRVCIIETSDGKLAKTVIAESGRKDAEVLVFNSCQSVNSKQIQDGMTYLGIMKDNLELLREALG